MIVFSRKQGESIVISDDIVVTVVEIDDERVRLGIDAPKEVPVHRREVHEALRQATERITIDPPHPSPGAAGGTPAGHVALAARLRNAVRSWFRAG